MAGLGEDAKIAWRNEVGEGFTIEADRDHLFRILLNLGRNAVQAIQGEGGGPEDNKGEIRIAAHRAGDHIHIDVEDTGPGLPEKARAHLFEAFSGGARAGGTGLGLAIADELARGHGGHIELASTGPAGTRFRVCIPAEETALGCAEAEAAGAAA
jgi:signal transduction histidine kinase